jgi:hypothetical protein
MKPGQMIVTSRRLWRGGFGGDFELIGALPVPAAEILR